MLEILDISDPGRLGAPSPKKESRIESRSAENIEEFRWCLGCRRAAEAEKDAVDMRLSMDVLPPIVVLSAKLPEAAPPFEGAEEP